MTNNKRINFGGDPVHDANSGILKGILPVRYRGNCEIWRRFALCCVLLSINSKKNERRQSSTTPCTQLRRNVLRYVTERSRDGADVGAAGWWWWLV